MSNQTVSPNLSQAIEIPQVSSNLAQPIPTPQISENLLDDERIKALLQPPSKQ